MAQPIDTAYVDLEARTDKAVNEIRAALKKINEAIKQAAIQLRKDLEAAANASADAFAKLAVTADAALAHIADEAAEIGHELRTEVAGGAQQAGQAIGRFARDAQGNLVNVSNEAGDTAEDLARNMALGARGAQLSIDRFAKAAVADLLKVAAAARLLRTQLSGVSNQMRTLFSVGVITQLAMQIMQVFQQFGGGIVAIMTKVGLAVGGVTLIVGGLAAALTGLATAAAAAVGAISQFVSLLISASGALAIVPGAIIALRVPLAVVKFALDDFSESLSNALSAETTSDFNAAIADLSKNAQAFARAMRDLKPAVDGLQLETQNRLFAGLDVSLKQLARAHLPTVNRYFKELATILNGVIRQGVAFLVNEQSKLDLRTIFVASSIAAENLGGAMIPLLQIFRDVSTVGAAVFAVLTEGLQEVTQGWADTVAEMRASGELAQLMFDGVAAVKQLASALGDVWGILRGIGQAATAGADGELGIFNFLDRLNESINSAQGQESLTQFFSDLSRVGAALAPVLDAIVAALGPLASEIAAIAEAAGPGLTIFIEELGDALLPVLQAFASLTSLITPLASLLDPLSVLLSLIATEAMPGFEAVIRSVASALTLLFPYAVALGSALSQLLQAVAPFIPVLAQAAAELIKLIVPGVITFLGALLSGVTALAPAITPVGNALSALLTALAPLLPLIGEIFSNALITLATALSAVAGTLGPVIGLLSEALIGALIAVLPPILELAQTALPDLLTAGASLFSIFAPLVPKIIELAQAFADSLLPQLPALTALMIDQVLPALYELATVLTAELIAALTEIIPQIPELTAAFIELVPWVIQIAALLIPFITYLVESAGMVGNLTAVLDLMTLALQMGNVAMGIIVSAIRHFFRTLEAANVVVVIFRDRIVNAIRWVVNATMQIPVRLVKALGNTKTLMFDAGADIINGLINGIKSKATAAATAARNAVSNAVQSAKNWLGIRSPSRRADREIGRPFAEGIVGGIHAEMNALRQTTGALANTLVSSTLQARPSELNGASLGSLTGGSPGTSAISGGIVFAPGAVSVTFTGAVPTEAEARQVGQSVGVGIADALARRNLQTTVRSI